LLLAAAVLANQVLVLIDLELAAQVDFLLYLDFVQYQQLRTQ
jgi:hypothetical protein